METKEDYSNGMLYKIGLSQPNLFTQILRGSDYKRMLFYSHDVFVLWQLDLSTEGELSCTPSQWCGSQSIVVRHQLFYVC